MRPQILLAIILSVPMVAMACGKSGNENPRTEFRETPVDATAGDSNQKPVDDRIAAPSSDQAPQAKTGCCVGKVTCDAKGRIVRKPNGSGGFFEYVYHPRHDKLIMVLNESFRTEFHYDDQGELTLAENSDGQVITLDYDGKSTIRRMIEVDRPTGTRRELAFKYNAAGKPVEITMVGVGKITVHYDDKNEITKVDSKQGLKMALEVTQAFQNLLSVIKPTGTRF